MSATQLTSEEIVEIVAVRLGERARHGEIVDALTSRGLDRKSAKRALRMARFGLELALSQSLGTPLTSSLETDPIVSAAMRYAKDRIGKEGCPRFLRRLPQVIKVVVFLLLVALAVGGAVLFGVYGTERLIRNVGCVVAAIALLTSPMIFYLIFRYDIQGNPFQILANLERRFRR